MSSQDITVLEDKMPLLDKLNTMELSKTLNEFIDTLNSQYISITSDSLQIIFNGKINSTALSKELKDKLLSTNYDIPALNGETVVLFDKPYLVSNIYCNSNYINDSKSNLIRLLTTRYTEKKMVTLNRIKNSAPNDTFNGVYIANEIIMGFILPTSILNSVSNFESIDCLDLTQLFTDNERLSAISKAHDNIFIAANELHEAIKSINIYINDKNKIKDSIEQEVKSLLNERDRLNTSKKNENEILNRIRSDIIKETENLAEIQDKNDKYAKTNKDLLGKIAEQRNQINSEQATLNDIRNNISDSNSELFELTNSLNRAKADINVTTLDMKGFSSESHNQFSKYFWLTLVSILLLAGVFVLIYHNAKTFSDLVDVNPTISTLNILLSRLPLITATTLIIGTLSALLFYLVNNMISVSEDKMNMLKASILAEQITGSLPKEEMTDDEIRDYKRNTKIELVMRIFLNKSIKIKDEKQTDTIKQVIDILKSLK